MSICSTSFETAVHFVLNLVSRFVITEWYEKATGQYYKGHGLTAHLEGRREAVDV